MCSFQVLSSESLETVESDRRCIVIRELIASKGKVSATVIHATAFTNGLIVDCRGLGRFWSYSTEWFRGAYENGSFHLIDCISGERVWGSEDGLDALQNIGGIKLKMGTGIRFKDEFTPFDRSVLIGKHVLMLALFREGTAVFLALGRKGRKGMIRRLDRDKNNNSPYNLRLRVFKKYLRERYPNDLLEKWFPGLADMNYIQEFRNSL